MCALVVWTTDYNVWARGDVIDALPDGWEFSREESQRPDWLILDVPGLSLSEGKAMALHEPMNQPVLGQDRPRRRFHKRLFGLDLDSLGLVDHVGKERLAKSVTVDAEAIRSLKTMKLPPEDDETGEPGIIVVKPVER